MVSDNSDHLNSPEAIRHFVEYNLGDGGKEVPFHWQMWSKDGEKKVKPKHFSNLTYLLMPLGLDIRECMPAI